MSFKMKNSASYCSTSAAFWHVAGYPAYSSALPGHKTSQPFLTITQGGYRADDAVHLADHVLATLGREGEGSASADRDQIFNAWRLLVETLSRQAPYIILFENLHWASESLLDLVEHSECS